MGVNAAAQSHGVPKTSLKDRISGRVVHGSKPGPRKYLTEEEKNLACYLQEVAEIGYGKSHKQVQDGWWRQFKDRQTSFFFFFLHQC